MELNGKYKTLPQYKRALQEFQKKYKLRKDWHEPDEVDIDARVVGDHLDNAFGDEVKPTIRMYPSQEYVVILTKAGQEVGRINLATLLAVACLE